MVRMTEKKGRRNNGSPSASLEEFCQMMGGKPIKSVLVANNGIAAVKFIRSVRMWSYETFGNERMVTFVAMATPEDMRINAEHIRLADQFVEVPGGSNNNNYANVQLIVAVAERLKVDAVWPGWGHASEVPALPETLKNHGIVFLGPPAGPMAALGDKIGSTIIAQAAGVQTVGWSGSEVTVPLDKCHEPIPDDIYRKACVSTTDEALSTCAKIGYPAMIKASWGGGGKGIRKVQNDEDVRNLFKQVQGEVPGSPIFLMKLATNCRHLEVQLVCDAFGNVAALHSRDCSIQRRHQKIIEEGPITVAPIETIRELEKGACRLASSVGYIGAATVEYLYSMETGDYFFLELNPRLQVEHPVTEWIANVNLPATQLMIGMGIPLWRMPEIRRLYGQPLGGGLHTWRHAKDAVPFSFTETSQVAPKGHVVAVRVTSEDPDDGFKPTSGRIQELSFRSKPDVWAYFSVKSGGGIHEYSDSQFGHFFAFGENRDDAISNMVLALKDVHIRGEIRTIVDYVIDLLHSQDYQQNNIHTGWLDNRIAMRHRVEPPPWHIAVIAGALYSATRQAANIISDYVGYLEKGQIPPKTLSLVSHQAVLNIDDVKYKVNLSRRSTKRYLLQVNNSIIEAEAHTLHDGGLLVQLDGNSHMVYGEAEPTGTRLFINGRTCLLRSDNDPSKVVAETACKLLRYLVPDGSRVSANTPYAEVEVMKMCMPLISPVSGKISFLFKEGQQAQAGDLVARMELEDAKALKQALPFTGDLPPLNPPTATPHKPQHRFAAALTDARMVLAGYRLNVREVVELLVESLQEPQLAVLQWQDCFAIHANRLPRDLREKLEGIWEECSVKEKDFFPAESLQEALEHHIENVAESDRVTQETLVAPLLAVVQDHSGGPEAYAVSIIKSLFEDYFRVEEPFSLLPEADVIEALRQEYKDQLTVVLDIVLSHQGLKRKNELLLELLSRMVAPNPMLYYKELQRFAALSHGPYSKVTVQANGLLETTRLKELRQTIVRSLSGKDISEIVEKMNSAPKTEKRNVSRFHAPQSMDEQMESVVNMWHPIEDALTGLFDHSDHSIQGRAVEAYLRRLYQPYLDITSEINIVWEGECLIATWQFWEEIPPPLLLPLTQEKNSQERAFSGKKRWGAMVVVPTIELIRSTVTKVLETSGMIETEKWKNGAREDGLSSIERQSSSGGGVPCGFGNVLHVVSLVKDETGDSGEQSSSDCLSDLAMSLLEGMEGQFLHTIRGVGVVSCMLQPKGEGEGERALRKSFHWSEEQQAFTEEPLLHQLEPPLADLLETEKVKNFEGITYSQSSDHQWHMYSLIDRPSGIRRAFLRALVRPGKYFESTSSNCSCVKTQYSSSEDSSSENSSSESWSENLSFESSSNSSCTTFGCPWKMGFGSKIFDLKSHDGEDTDCEREENNVVPDFLCQKRKSILEFAVESLSRAFQGGLEELESSTHHLPPDRQIEHVHIFISVLQTLDLSSHGGGGGDGVMTVVAGLEDVGQALNRKFSKKMCKLGVMGWEVRLRVKGNGEEDGAYRIVDNNPSGQAMKLEIYRETASETFKGIFQVVYTSVGKTLKGSLHGISCLARYSPLGAMDRQRLVARKQGTTYVHDFPQVFEAAVQSAWVVAKSENPLLEKPENGPIFEAKELCFAEKLGGWGVPLVEVPLNSLNPLNRHATKCAMVGWNFFMKTPECPLGRQIMVVANDITVNSGSFAPLEDAFFQDVTNMACEKKLPLVYLAANSGARIGLAEEVKSCFKVGWSQENSPEKGFQYLYLTPEDYLRIKGSVRVQKIHVKSDSSCSISSSVSSSVSSSISGSGSISISSVSCSASLKREENGGDEGEIRYMILDVIGEEDGLGVECLSGSGAIAGAFSRAYEELPFTLTFVTGRAVGIGAYLARLGIRCIQRIDQPIILTGFSALNKLLGREVYTSHMQLGGPKVMATNGVVHKTVGDDREGIDSIIKWLSYVPHIGGGPLPILPSIDPIDRELGYIPEISCDPRAAISGETGPDGIWKSGFFDKDSFMETFATWAQTVVTGRARLGGIPVGVVGVEVKTVLQKIPADPGQPDSHERIQPQAGQVWFPDSATKTANAMRDFDREGLPLFILANWRGFSGGQRDLFEGILQSGSLIVEQLRKYRQPVFVYIPKTGELRGGAWVVVDSQINPEMVEMYADETARGGVLEPEGIVEIKFREREIFQAMHRLDPELIDLDHRMKVDRDNMVEISQKMKVREKEILPVYKQVAIKFAELHDTPFRMVSKGSIRNIVPWEKSRMFFYHRLNRRLAELKLVSMAKREIEMSGIEKRMSGFPKGINYNVGFDFSVKKIISAIRNMFENRNKGRKSKENLNNLERMIGEDKEFLEWISDDLCFRLMGVVMEGIVD